MNDKTIFTREDILSILPHRPPFLFVDRIIRFSPAKRITAEFYIDPSDPVFQGHFPTRPIFPGVLITDACAQTSGLLWGFTRAREKQKDAGTPSPDPELFFLAADQMKYHNPALPGETIRISSARQRSLGTLYSYGVTVFAGRKHIAEGTMTLAMVKESV